jgi:hypothetical protein
MITHFAGKMLLYVADSARIPHHCVLDADFPTLCSILPLNHHLSNGKTHLSCSFSLLCFPISFSSDCGSPLVEQFPTTCRVVSQHVCLRWRPCFHSGNPGAPYSIQLVVHVFYAKGSKSRKREKAVASFKQCMELGDVFAFP